MVMRDYVRVTAAADAIMRAATEQGRAAVANGMAYLDEVAPGWESKIDLDRLNIGSKFNCVLGQVFGNYLLYVTERDLGLAWAIDHGFASTPFMFVDFTSLWREAIQTRRAALVPRPMVPERELVLA